jgi:hypothetical protein
MILICIKDLIMRDSARWKIHLSKFRIDSNDSKDDIKLKFGIVGILCDENNYEMIIPHFEHYIYSTNTDLAVNCIKIWTDIAARIPQMRRSAMSTFALLLSNENGITFFILGELVSQTVISIRQLFLNDTNITPEESFRDMLHSFVNTYQSLKSSVAKASILWLVGHHHQQFPGALDIVRIALQSFAEESRMVKFQLLKSISILYLAKYNDEDLSEYKRNFLKEALNYAFDMAKLDSDYDVRDCYRFFYSLVETLDEQKRKRLLEIFSKYEQVLPTANSIGNHYILLKNLLLNLLNSHSFS